MRCLTRSSAKMRCTEVSSIFNDMEYRVAINVHQICDYVLVEAKFSCTKTDSKLKWSWMYPLERVTSSSDVLQRLMSLRGFLLRTSLYGKIKIFLIYGWKNVRCRFPIWKRLNLVQVRRLRGANSFWISACLRFTFHKSIGFPSWITRLPRVLVTVQGVIESA